MKMTASERKQTMNPTKMLPSERHGIPLNSISSAILDAERHPTTTARKKQRQAEQIKAHGENLLHLFPNATERDPIALCKKLRRLEAKASRITTDYCNGDFDAGENGEKLDAALDPILAKINAILGNTGKNPVPVFVNRDPRGYALKISSEWTFAYCQQTGRRIYSDWGGYGIIAPEITGD